MPKKTKKEKLLAQHHWTQSPLVVPNAPRSPIPVGTTTAFRLAIPTSKIYTSPQAIAVSVNEFTAIKRDLIKTLCITMGIIVSEFLLAHYLPH